MNQRFPSLKLWNRTLNTSCSLVDIVKLAVPAETRVVDGSPLKNAICPAAPMTNPADGFEPITGAAMIIFFPACGGGEGGFLRHSRMMPTKSVS